ncbi:pseudouridine synthase [Podospora didyma]|uniref:Pseudouridine synthase n=1 Tax=Podospora didyma TaxID=330526 RepID=A0AAE0KGD7_9PEZI|nr:pseudouridine synthase [Podospora didyma]
MSHRQSTHVPAVRAETEKSLGIALRSSPINFCWTGDVRKRYTDFLVYEIRKDGSVIHLEDYDVDEAAEQQARNFTHPNAPKPTPVPFVKPVVITSTPIQPVADNDRVALASLIQEHVAAKLLELDENIQAKKQLPADERNVIFETIADRAERGKVHQEIRRIFGGRIETVADAFGVITASGARWATNIRKQGQNQGKGKGRGGRDQRREQGGRNSRENGLSFAKLGGDYLHFTLYKENKDTMDAINTIARLLKVKASNFGFAGTKDRRAATVQRVSVFRQRSSNMIWLNSRLPNVKIGDFSYEQQPLQLGQHGGNEFIITLKNCLPLGGGAELSVERRMRSIQQSLECGLAYLKHHGYINYFGLQRFGTHSIGTHLLGMEILKGDYEGAIDDILHVDDNLLQDVLNNAPKNQTNGNGFDNNRDDLNRARAITTWKATKNADKALELLPKRFSSEFAIIRHLGRNPKDYMGAILSITRGMRMMYIHAYQSFVWNHMVSHRWAKYGDRVVEGDLVVLPEDKFNIDGTVAVLDGEAVSEPGSDIDDFYAQAYALTAADVANCKYTIFDVVMPTPGFDVMYPRNDIGDEYATFMRKEENGGLDPYEMRRRHKEFSLSGNYRHILGRFIVEPEYCIRRYSDDTQQMYPTDLDFCNHKKKLEKQKVRAERKYPAVAKWNHFADNASTWDSAMATDRRRKASQEPASEGTTTTNETWVQTGIDGDSKRVKLARHHQVKTEEGHLVTKAHSPVEVGLPPIKIEDAEASIPLNAVIAAPKSLSEAYYESIGQAPRPKIDFEKTLKKEMKVDIVASVETEQPSDDKYNWYGNNMPTISNAAPSNDDTKVVESVSNRKTTSRSPSPVDETKVCGIEVPTFRTASTNPIVAPSEANDVDDNPKANKVAVILKFQLKTSNYATIVLRELMGTNVEA